MSSQPKRPTVLRKFLQMKELTVLVPLVVYIIIVQLVNDAFLSVNNITNILRVTGFTLITAVGMTMVLVSGGLDLSVGSIVGVGGVISSLAAVAGMGPILSLVLGVLAGLGIGAVNGFLIIRFKIPSLIMTLGMLYMARGLVYIITQGVPVFPLPDTFQSIEQSSIFGIPMIVYIAALMAVVGHIVLKRTTFGRSVYAVGGSAEAARMSGISVRRTSFTTYLITGGLAALTGVLTASRLGSAQAGAGTGHELTVIAAVIIGGTSMFGGVGTILGTVLGALFMSILSNSMTLMRISVYWQNLVIGALLVSAVVIDQVARRFQLERSG